MLNFSTIDKIDKCTSDDFCICSVCSRNQTNGGYCNQCSKCNNGSFQQDSELPCFNNLKQK